MALALFLLALIGGLLVALTPVPQAWRTAALGPSESVVLLALSPPKPVIALPVTLALSPVIEKPPIAGLPPQPSAVPMAADTNPVDDKAADDPGPPPILEPLESPAPLAVAEATGAAGPTPEPAVETVPSPVAEIQPEPEPAPEPETAPDSVAGLEPTLAPAVETVPSPVAEIQPEPEPAPALETVSRPASEALPQPILVAALPVSADDGEPVPYDAGELAPDEAAAMPEEEPPPTVAVPDAPVIPPVPETPAEPLLDPAKAPPDPVWLAYARPSSGASDRPRIAVVVAGLGLGRAATTAAIRLPGAITLAFASHARDLQEWIDLARAAGHEILLELPMEPENYPQTDPGPHALLTTLTGAENVERLTWHLDRASGYVGVTHSMGSRFTASADHMRPILSALKVRGLMFLDARTSANSVAASLATAIGLPRAINNRFLDTQASRLAIDRRIDEIERIARGLGFSVAVGHAYPVTIERLERWIETLDSKKLALVPVSALVNKQAVE